MIDPLGKDQVVNICAELKRDYDMTLIVVEHNIEAFAPLADKVVVVNHGRIERVGPPAVHDVVQRLHTVEQVPHRPRPGLL